MAGACFLQPEDAAANTLTRHDPFFVFRTVWSACPIVIVECPQCARGQNRRMSRQQLPVDCPAQPGSLRRIAGYYDCRCSRCLCMFWRNRAKQKQEAGCRSKTKSCCFRMFRSPSGSRARCIVIEKEFSGVTVTERQRVTGRYGPSDSMTLGQLARWWRVQLAHRSVTGGTIGSR